MKPFLLFVLPVLMALNACDGNDTDPKDELTGTWLLEMYEYSQGNLELAPENEKPVALTFENGILKGTTGNNFVEGEYSVDSDTLTLSKLSITELPETEWDRKFWVEMSEAQVGSVFVIRFQLNTDVLIFEYSSDKRMILKKN